MIIIQHYKHIQTSSSILSSIARNKIWNNRQTIWYFCTGIGFPLRSALKPSHTCLWSFRPYVSQIEVWAVFFASGVTQMSHKNLQDCPSQRHLTQYQHITIDRLLYNSVCLWNVLFIEKMVIIPCSMLVIWRLIDPSSWTRHCAPNITLLIVWILVWLVGRTTSLSLSCSIVTQ